MSGRIKKTTQPDSRVGAKTLGFLPRAMPLPLETTVEEPDRVTQIMPDIADFSANRFWRHKIVAKTCGINHSSEQTIVKRPGASVEPFDWVGHHVKIRHLPGLQLVRLAVWRGSLSLDNGGLHGDQNRQRKSRKAGQRTFQLGPGQVIVVVVHVVSNIKTALLQKNQVRPTIPLTVFTPRFGA